MNEQEILLYAALTKLIKGEPMSSSDLRRIIALIRDASWAIEKLEPEEIAGLQSELIKVLQQRFMRQA